MRTVALALGLSLFATATQAKDVNWWKGTPDEAFAKAKAGGTPTLVFWTSAWCPSCSELMGSTFRNDSVRAQLDSFVTVLLDGDAPGAQAWGERLVAGGYPALIVLSAEGRELTRIAPDLLPEHFALALKAARVRNAPIKEVLSEAKSASDGQKVSEDSWRMIGYHAWDEEVAVGVNPAVLEKTLGALEAKMPAKLRVERSRMFARWLGYAVRVAAAQETAGSGKAAVSDDQRVVANLRVDGILANRELQLANLDMISYGALGVVQLLHHGSSPARASLVASWRKVALALAEDKQLSAGQRLSALIPVVELAALDRGEGNATKELREMVTGRVEAAESACKDMDCIVSMVQTGGYLLQRVGPVTAERDYYERLTSQKGPAAYFAWSGLSAGAKIAGRGSVAADAARKAFELSDGPATRLQWGARYLSTLLESTPGAVAEIRKESLRVLGEVATDDGAFQNRGRARLAELFEKKYPAWATTAERRTVVKDLRAAMLPVCEKLSAKVISKGSPQSRCTELFAARP